MASCTKLMTSIAALQCVERGQIQLDDDVSTVLTELKDIQIITGFKEGTKEPTFVPAKNKITLRYTSYLKQFPPTLTPPVTSSRTPPGLATTA